MLANALIIIVCIFKHVHPVIIVSVMGAIFFASGILFKNLKREHKADGYKRQHIFIEELLSVYHFHILWKRYTDFL